MVVQFENEMKGKSDRKLKGFELPGRTVLPAGLALKFNVVGIKCYLNVFIARFNPKGQRDGKNVP